MSTIERAGPLNPSQQAHWIRLYWRDLGLPFGTPIHLWLLPEPVSLQTAMKAWRTLVERHEILRTVFMAAPDGRPMQSVYAVDDFRMPVVTQSIDDIEPFCNDRSVPLVTNRAYLLLPPWHARLFVNGDQVHVVGLIADHVVTDGVGMANWEQQFKDLCAGRSHSSPRFQPLDRTDPGGGGLKPADEPIFRAPQCAVPGRLTDLAGPRYSVTKVEYHGLVPAVNAAARNYQVTAPAVLMFVFAWLIARYGSQDRVFFMNLYANGQFGDGSIDCRVLPVDILAMIDDAQPLGEAVRAVLEAILSAYSQAGKRGEWQFNYRSVAAEKKGCGAINSTLFAYFPEPSSGRDEPVVGDVRTTITESENPDGEPFGTRVLLGTTGSTLSLEWVVDQALFPREAVRELAKAVPTIITRLLEHPELLVGSLNDLSLDVRSPVADCTKVRGDWVRLASVSGVLRDCPGVTRAEAQVVDDELVATVELKPDMVPFDVHEFVLTRLPQHTDILAPHAYRILRGMEVETWRPGEDSEPLTPTSRAERDLAAAITQTHGITVTDLAATYVGAGCSVWLAPAVIEMLRRCGWAGTIPDHFISPFPLRSIARALVRIDEEDR